MHESSHRNNQHTTEKLLTVTMGDMAKNIALCVVSGEIDLFTGPILQKKLIKAIHAVPRQLVID